MSSAKDRRIKKLEDALQRIRKHHVEINQRVGRPPQASRTIAICDEALTPDEPTVRL